MPPTAGPGCGSASNGPHALLRGRTSRSRIGMPSEQVLGPASPLRNPCFLVGPEPPTGLIVALILTASLASEPTAALILTGVDREAADHHQRDWEDSPHAMLDDREGPSHAMLKVWECHADSGAFWRFRRANIRVVHQDQLTGLEDKISGYLAFSHARAQIAVATA